MKTVLVVDDAPNIVELLRLYLEQAGYATIAAADGPTAIELHHRHRPDLVVLDVMLPGLDGFEVCRAIRREADTPIIMLTARSDDVDAIVGLELGADDYVTKPFNPRALIARVKAILRRADGSVRASRPLEVGDLRIEPRRREVTLAGRSVELRAREFDLLAAFAREPGAVLSRDALLEDVWGTDFPGETRTVDVHVSELRKKLGPGGPAIESVRGVGYRFVAPPEAARPGSGEGPAPADRSSDPGDRPARPARPTDA
jgi:DNA-binding response OmpR family regulator